MFCQSKVQQVSTIKLITALLIALSMQGCVINTGGQQEASKAQKIPDQKEASSRPGKVSLEEAARFNMTLGANYLQQNNLSQAIAKLEKAVEQEPNLALAHTYLALAYERYEEIDKAKKHYNRAVKLAPNDPVALNNYGTFLCRHDKVDESLKFFEKAASNKRYQTPDAALENAGVCAKKIDNYVLADRYFRGAVRLNPALTSSYYHLTEVNIKLNALPAAQEFFQKYEKKVLQQQETPDYLYLAYRLNKALENPGEAGRFALRLQQKFPNSLQTKEFLQRRK